MYFPLFEIGAPGVETNPRDTLYSCDFEQESPCGRQWSLSTNNIMFSWETHSGPTATYAATRSTGPTGDHTRSDGSGEYIQFLLATGQIIH